MYYNVILRELREEKGITQEELGKIFYCKQITISKYERGKRGLNIEMLIKYAKYFNVTTDYILQRDLETNIKK